MSKWAPTAAGLVKDLDLQAFLVPMVDFTCPVFQQAVRITWTCRGYTSDRVCGPIPGKYRSSLHLQLHDRLTWRFCFLISQVALEMRSESSETCCCFSVVLLPGSS
jgi:hypothetical protein